MGQGAGCAARQPVWVGVVSAYTKPGAWSVWAGGILYRSTAELVFEVGALGSGLRVSVPAGVTFDVSVPQHKPAPINPFRWPFWFLRAVFVIFANWLVDVHDERFRKAAALHDVLLRAGWDRATAGAVFHSALKADGVPRWQRLLMWLAVSLFKFE